MGHVLALFLTKDTSRDYFFFCGFVVVVVFQKHEHQNLLA